MHFIKLHRIKVISAIDSEGVDYVKPESPDRPDLLIVYLKRKVVRYSMVDFGKIKCFKGKLWRHQRKGALLRNKQCLPRSVISTLCDSSFYQNYAGSENIFYSRCSSATKIEDPDQTPRIKRLIRAYGSSSAIRSYFVNDVTKMNRTFKWIHIYLTRL